MIRLNKLSKVFRTEEMESTVLDNISLEINQGDFVSIMGQSGCGKSTLLSILGLLDDPTSGEYFFQGKNIANESEDVFSDIRKKNIGFVFQSFNLIDELTVFENIEIALLYNGISAAERRKRVETVMAKMDISHRSKHMPAQLSGGQQQRVAIARALAGEPLLILADEPTGNLDSAHGAEVMDMLTQLNKEGATIIMVTHSPEHAKYGNRIVCLKDGKIVSQSTPTKDATTTDAKMADAATA